MAEPDEIIIGGVPIKLVSEVEAELSDYVVCMRDVPGVPRGPLAKHFGKCSRCRHAIYWADSAPTLPRRICVTCVMTEAGADS